MTPQEENIICDEALNLVEAKYSKEQLTELKIIEQMRDKLTEINLRY